MWQHQFSPAEEATCKIYGPSKRLYEFEVKFMVNLTSFSYDQFDIFQLFPQACKIVPIKNLIIVRKLTATCQLLL